jgi:hypothetical protein
MEEQKIDKALEDDLKKVETEALKKALRHRVDEYIAIALGLGSVLLIWILQEMGFF